jgi:CoA-binding domain
MCGKCWAQYHPIPSGKASRSFAPDGGACGCADLHHAGFRHIQQRWIIRCQLARTMATITESGYVDDDPSKKDLKIDGIPVIGNVDEIPQLVGRYHVDEILIAVPSASGQQMQIC